MPYKLHQRDAASLEAWYQQQMERLRSDSSGTGIHDDSLQMSAQRDRLPAAFVSSGQHHGCGYAIDSVVSDGCQVISAEVMQSILCLGVTIQEHSHLYESLVLPRVSIGKRCLIRRAIIEQGCSVPDGVTIGLDPEQDQQWFRRTSGGLVLITAESLARYQAATRQAA